jgi:O-antigen/teichoic acid export membrane protein
MLGFLFQLQEKVLGLQPIDSLMTIISKSNYNKKLSLKSASMTQTQCVKLSSLGLWKLWQNIGQTLARHFLAILFGLGTTIIIARILGPAGNGQYAVAMLLPTFLATFLNLGISPGNVYYIGRHAVTVRVAMRTSVRIWLGLTIAGIIAGAFLLNLYGNWLFPGVSKFYLWLALMAFPVGLLQGLLSSLFQGMQDFRRYNLTTLVAPTFLLFFVSLFMIFGRSNLSEVIIAFTIAQTAGILTTWLLLRSVLVQTNRISVIAEFEYAKQLIQYGFKAHLGNILAFINYRADIFLVNLLINPAAAGVYVIAVVMSEKLWILSQAVSTVILPKLSELNEDDESRKQLTPFIARWVLLITLMAATIMALISIPFIRILFGYNYSDAVRPLLFLLPGIVLGSLSRVLANDIAARGRPELNMYTEGIIVIVNVAGNLLLIPFMGTAGAALATTIAYSINAIFRIWVYSWLSGNKWYAHIQFNSLDQQFIRIITNWSWKKN